MLRHAVRRRYCGRLSLKMVKMLCIVIKLLMSSALTFVSESRPQESLGAMAQQGDKNGLHGVKNKSGPSSRIQHLLRGDLAVLCCILFQATGCLPTRAALNVGLGRPLPPRPNANTTHQVLDGGPHFLVSVGVDDRVHDGVENSEEQQPAFKFQDIALFALESVQKQNHKSRSPTDHKRS